MLRAFTLLLAAPAFAAPPQSLSTRLEAQVRDVPARVGIAVLDVDRGPLATVRGDVPAPMASTFKLPLAVAVMRRAQERGIGLDTPVHVAWLDRSPAWSPLAARIPEAGADVPLDALLETMVADSDNTAADVLLRWMGGPEAVTAALVSVGVRDVRIARNERTMTHSLAGLEEAPVPEARETVEARLARVPAAQERAAFRRFLADGRDQASPVALARVLASLARGELLDAPHGARLLAMLRATRTGARRLAAGLPAGTTLAHKTGTLPARTDLALGTNDVGLVELGGHRIVIAVLVTDARMPLAAAEDVVAGVARTVAGALSGPEAAPPAR